MENTPFDRDAALQRVRTVMSGELTQWQRTVLQEIYFEGKTQTQVANKYGVNRSTVCRTLHRAETRLRRFLAYYA